jgi:hypothetical protein
VFVARASSVALFSLSHNTMLPEGKEEEEEEEEGKKGLFFFIRRSYRAAGISLYLYSMCVCAI